ncbi:MAG: hypothetical protein H7039_17940 [Bryobacteraceae bacterium]|nr:hypothetical protein [Bryobacteraceae bacterium]
MARRSESKKARLQELLSAHGGLIVDDQAFSGFQNALAPVSEAYLRKLLHDSGAELDVFVAGVSLHSPEDLRRTLVSFADLYSEADPAGRQKIREHVIAVKSRLRAMVSRTVDSDQRIARTEMLEEMMAWLENPEVFPIWMRLKVGKKSSS